MRQTLLRWTLYFVSLLVAGPVAGMLVGSVHSVDGGPASPLVSASPVLGLAAGLGVMVLALATGLVTSRAVGLAPGLTAAGIVVAWASWRTADVGQLIRTARSGSPLGMLAVEGLLFGAAGLAIALACWMASRRADETDSRGATKSFTIRRALLPGKTFLVVIAAALVAGAVAAGLIAVTPLKGQAVFAAIAAGTFAAAGCRLVDYEAPTPTMFVPIVLLAAVGPLTGLVLAGAGGPLGSTFRGALFPLANISPLDWVAGGLLGIPLGVSWAGSMIEKRVQEAPAKA